MSSSAVETSARAMAVQVTQDELVVSLTDGRKIAVPLTWFPRLLHAPEAQRQRWQLLGDGEGIHWSEIDEDLSVAGLLRGTPAPRPSGQAHPTGEPKMSSPISYLLPLVSDYVFRIVPERNAELRSEINALGIIFAEDNEADFIFRADPDPDRRRVTYSAYAVEVLWVISYVAWLYYEHRTNGSVDTRDPNTDLGRAVTMLKWSLTTRRNDLGGPWPEAFPLPSDSPPYASTIHVANELAAVAVAWILHHEIGHLKMGHTAHIPSDLRKQQEMVADRAATDYILRGATNRLERSKRALGIGIATLTMIARDLNRHSFVSQTHPESYKRVVTSLETEHLFQEDDAARYVACMLMKLLMHIFEVTPPDREYDTPMDCLNDLAFILSQLPEAW